MQTAAPKVLLYDRQLMAEKEFWLETLSGEIERTNLRLDRPRSPVAATDLATLICDIDGDLYHKLTALTGDGPFLTYTVLLAAFKICLYRYTGNTRLVVGSPARRLEGSEPNALAVVSRIDPKASFRDLLMSLRQILLDVYSKQRYPFANLLRDLGLEEVRDRCPIFDLALALEDIHAPLPAVGHDLTLTLRREPERLVGQAVFRRDLFDDVTVESFLDHFRAVLRSGLEDHGCPIARLEMLATTERQQLLEGWNQPQDSSEVFCLHQLLAEQARRTPQATAVVGDDEELTYVQLDRRASRLARRLSARGFGLEQVVAISARPGAGRIIGVIGILKAGAAYLPLDPAQAGERMAFMLRQSGAAALVTESSLVEHLPKFRGSVLLLDKETDDRQATARGSFVNEAVTPGNLAYVIYTSGSTGQPKGVAVSHGAIAHRAATLARVFALGPGDRQSQVVSLSFDVWGEEVFPPLISGAAVVCLPAISSLAPDELMSHCEQLAVTKMNLPASYWHQVVDALAVTQKRVPPRLRLFCAGAESPSAAKLRSWNRLLDHPQRFINVYGPTEAAILTHLYELELPCAADAIPEQLPIGAPLADARAYVLDGLMRPLPAEAPGELFLAGARLARSYLGQAAATAACFLPDPFVDQPGARMYRTGDLVRWRRDGQVVFHGRVDHQVKVRGFRIELGEIEAVLSEHPEVAAEIVIVRDTPSGDKSLLAYAVPHEGSAPTPDELRRYLRQRLPAYMVPARLMVLDEMPLNAHGKIDRQALPSPELSEPGERQTYVAPREPLELRLTQLWEDVLGLQPIGMRDNFFELGGHSLLAVRLLTRVQKELGERVPLTGFFQSATIEDLAQLLRRENDARPESLRQSPLVPIHTGGAAPPLFCVHPTGGTVLCYFHLARALGPERPFYGLQACGVEEGQKPLARIEDMAAHYVDSLRQIQSHGPYLLSGWSFGGAVAFEMARQLLAAGEEVAHLALFDTFAASAFSELPQMDDAEVLVALFEGTVSLSLERLRQMSPEEQLAYALDKARQADMLPPDFGLDRARSLLRVSKANLRAIADYSPLPYPGSLTLYHALEEKETAPRRADDATLGWGALATASVDIERVPGDHQTMLMEPHVRTLAARLRSRLPV